jgi:hypothetical protein
MPQSLFPTMENLVWKDIGLRKLDGKFGWEIWMKTPI